MYKDFFIDFFNSRGLKLNIKRTPLTSFLSQGFSLFSFKFLKVFNFSVHIKLNRNFIRKYKNRLKMIVNNADNFDLITLIKKINFEINEYTMNHYFFNQRSEEVNELDIYLYKIIWKFVKRCHPRRSNLWVYKKYWKDFSGLWKFCAFDNIKGKIFYLNSHKVFNSTFYYLPLSLNSYNTFNSLKLTKSVFKKYSFNFSNIYSLIYKKQQGLCFCCNTPLASKNSKLVNISNYLSYKSSLIINLYLFHRHCI